MLLPLTSLEPNHHLAILSPPTVPDRFASLKCHSAHIYRVPSAGKAQCTSDLKGNELTKLTQEEQGTNKKMASYHSE